MGFEGPPVYLLSYYRSMAFFCCLKRTRVGGHTPRHGLIYTEIRALRENPLHSSWYYYQKKVCKYTHLKKSMLQQHLLITASSSSIVSHHRCRPPHQQTIITGEESVEAGSEKNHQHVITVTKIITKAKK